jgi:hypothetical protein
MIRKPEFLSWTAVGLLTLALSGCESHTPPPPERPAGQTDVKVGPGGVDVEVDKNRPDGKKVDVEVGGGQGVNVDVKDK